MNINLLTNKSRLRPNSFDLHRIGSCVKRQTNSGIRPNLSNTIRILYRMGRRGNIDVTRIQNNTSLSIISI